MSPLLPKQSILIVADEERGLGREASDLIFNTAPMHDIGQIGIPDAILLKPGALDAEEWQIMRQHPLMGAEIIGKHDNALLETARITALNHHEKWDGSGNPRGLRGTDIPLARRIVAIADVFDALVSMRPHKAAARPRAVAARPGKRPAFRSAAAASLPPGTAGHPAHPRHLRRRKRRADRPRIPHPGNLRPRQRPERLSRRADPPQERRLRPR